MSLVTDYWPKDVGYDSFSGYNVVKYPDEQNVTDERLRHVVDSWKHTAQEHRLNTPVANSLSCVPCNAHEKCYTSSCLESDSSTETKTVHGKICEVEAVFDVDETPGEKETDITIRIKGIYADTEVPYTLSVTVSRYPSKMSTVLVMDK